VWAASYALLDYYMLSSSGVTLPRSALRALLTHMAYSCEDAIADALVGVHQVSLACTRALLSARRREVAMWYSTGGAAGVWDWRKLEVVA